MLLARFAECLFWQARYIERSDNLARILDVNETFSRGRRTGQNWASIIALYADDERFYAKHRQATATTVSRFYVTDPENPNSILSCIRAARENARTLRPLLSTEMWMQVNMFYNQLKEIDDRDLALSRLPRLCDWIKSQCQAHIGVAEGTFFRDQGWHFFRLGQMIERADQTTRLLDTKYHALLPSVEDVGSPLDIAQWNAVLRSAAGYHGFRRVHPRGMTPTLVAGFLLFNDQFPRSLQSCISTVDETLHILRSRHGLRRGTGALEVIDEVRATLDDLTIEKVLAEGLHEFIDWVQRQLMAVTGEVGRGFFGAE